MPTLIIKIPIAADWPTSKELGCRNKVEMALGASKLMQCIGSGGGLGEMHLAFRVDDDARVASARGKIEMEMALLMPGSDYEVSVQCEPVTNIQIKVGDVFLVPLDKGKHAVGLCTFVFQAYERFIACRIFEAVVSESKIAHPLPATSAFDPLFVFDHSIADGSWPIVGSAKVEPRQLIYRSAGGIYNGDEFLKPTDYSEEVPNLYFSGPVAVEAQLREHFGQRHTESESERTQHST